MIWHRYPFIDQAILLSLRSILAQHTRRQWSLAHFLCGGDGTCACHQRVGSWRCRCYGHRQGIIPIFMRYFTVSAWVFHCFFLSTLFVIINWLIYLWVHTNTIRMGDRYCTMLHHADCQTSAMHWYSKAMLVCSHEGLSCLHNILCLWCSHANGFYSSFNTTKCVIVITTKNTTFS